MGYSKRTINIKRRHRQSGRVALFTEIRSPHAFDVPRLEVGSFIDNGEVIIYRHGTRGFEGDRHEWEELN